MDKKQVLRKRMKQRLNCQRQSERRKKSRVIHRKLFNEKEFLVAKCVMLYVSRGTDEVESGPVIKKALSMHKKVVLPVSLVRENKIRPVSLENFKKEFLKKGPYGIYEPKESNLRKAVRFKNIDLVVVPGLAFDKKNNRLGRGKGYYDKFLRSLPKDTPKIGLGFRFQLFRKIPTTKNDISLTKVITD